MLKDKRSRNKVVVCASIKTNCEDLYQKLQIHLDTGELYEYSAQAFAESPGMIEKSVTCGCLMVGDDCEHEDDCKKAIKELLIRNIPVILVGKSEDRADVHKDIKEVFPEIEEKELGNILFDVKKGATLKTSYDAIKEVIMDTRLGPEDKVTMVAKILDSDVSAEEQLDRAIGAILWAWEFYPYLHNNTQRTGGSGGSWGQVRDQAGYEQP